MATVNTKCQRVAVPKITLISKKKKKTHRFSDTVQHQSYMAEAVGVVTER
jgi:hypothetical protein